MSEYDLIMDVLADSESVTVLASQFGKHNGNWGIRKLEMVTVLAIEPTVHFVVTKDKNQKSFPTLESAVKYYLIGWESVRDTDIKQLQLTG